MKLAISYIRWSSPQQRLRDSKRRQVEKTESFCAANKLVLDQRLVDDGKSAFKGKHRAVGSDLGRFLADVKAGKIPKGTVLVVESLDRLSRETVPIALRQFLEIIEHEIDIVTLIDEQWYSQRSLGADSAPLLMSLVYMMRAHDEVKHRSNRLGSAWKEKRRLAIEEGRPMTSICPGWLRLSKDAKSYEVIEARVKKVRLIFWLTIRGYGKQRIAGLFNRHRVPTWGVKGKASLAWHHSYIDKILHNRAVLGEFTPFTTQEAEKRIEGRKVQTAEVRRYKREEAAAPLKNYYPAIIDEATFQKIQLRATGPRGPIGKTVTNVFQGLLKDGDFPKYTMCYKDHGDAAGKWRYVYSDHRRVNPEEPRFSWNYNHLEKLVLNYLRELDWSGLTVEKDAEIRGLGNELAIAEGRLKELSKEVKHLIALAKSSGNISEVAEELGVLETQRTDLRGTVHKLKADIAARKGFSAQDTIDLLQAMAADRKNLEIRFRLRTELRRYVERIELYRTFPERLFKNMNLPSPGPGLKLEEFLHARCLRIIFRNGSERWVVDRGEEVGFGVRIEGKTIPEKAILETEDPGGRKLVDARTSSAIEAKEGMFQRWKRKQT